MSVNFRFPNLSKEIKELLPRFLHTVKLYITSEYRIFAEAKLPRYDFDGLYQDVRSF